MPEALFDDRARAQRRARALTREPRPFLAARIVEDWRERLAVLARRPARALVTGVPPALEGELAEVADAIVFAPSFDAIAGVEEDSLDLLLVLGELEARDDLPLLLRIARTRLAPGGHLLGTVAGGQSLPALRESLHAADSDSGAFAARTHPRIEAGAFAHLLAAAGFADPICDIDRVRLRYRSFERLIGDLRDHGATNVLSARPRRGLSRRQLGKARDAFAALARDGATAEMVELIHYSAWAATENIRP